MKKNNLLYVILIVVLLFGVSACEGTDSGDDGNEPETVVEQKENTSDEDTADSKDATESLDTVYPELDENGNPTGEYAQYLWEQEQLEAAKNSLVEEVVREQYEEDYESHVFPLD